MTRRALVRVCVWGFELSIKHGLYRLATLYSQVGTWALVGRWLRV